MRPERRWRLDLQFTPRLDESTVKVHPTGHDIARPRRGVWRRVLADKEARILLENAPKGGAPAFAISRTLWHGHGTDQYQFAGTPRPLVAECWGGF
jgi:hypothetical protein